MEDSKCTNATAKTFTEDIFVLLFLLAHSQTETPDLINLKETVFTAKKNEERKERKDAKQKLLFVFQTPVLSTST